MQNALMHEAYFFHGVIVTGDEEEALADGRGRDGRPRHVQQDLEAADRRHRDPFEDKLFVTKQSG